MFYDKYNDNCGTNIIFIMKYIYLVRYTIVMFGSFDSQFGLFDFQFGSFEYPFGIKKKL